MESRQITLYTTLGKIIRLQSDAKTWGDIRPLINEEGINTSEMRAQENVKKTSLEHDDAELPEGAFTIFFTKINSKAGSEISYRELRRAIKTLVDSDDAARDFFNEDRNYTNKSKSDLENLYEIWTNPESKQEADNAPVVQAVEDANETFYISFEEAFIALETYIEENEDDLEGTEVFLCAMDDFSVDNTLSEITDFEGIPVESSSVQVNLESVEDLEETKGVLTVLIAEVKALIKEKTALDKEARSLGLL
jgi:truncated hemoglobin YjbI